MRDLFDTTICEGGACRVDPARLKQARSWSSPEKANEQHSGIMIFTKSECPICDKAKNVIDQVLAEAPEIKLTTFDLDTVEGLVEGSMRNTLEVPTILVLENGNEKARWEGRAPLLNELTEALK